MRGQSPMAEIKMALQEKEITLANCVGIAAHFKEAVSIVCAVATLFHCILDGPLPFD
jgi:hypothetical protein